MLSGIRRALRWSAAMRQRRAGKRGAQSGNGVRRSRFFEQLDHSVRFSTSEIEVEHRADGLVMKKNTPEDAVAKIEKNIQARKKSSVVSSVVIKRRRASVSGHPTRPWEETGSWDLPKRSTSAGYLERTRALSPKASRLLGVATLASTSESYITRKLAECAALERTRSLRCKQYLNGYPNRDFTRRQPSPYPGSLKSLTATSDNCSSLGHNQGAGSCTDRWHLSGRAPKGSSHWRFPACYDY